jgi:hypothetical protein
MNTKYNYNFEFNEKMWGKNNEHFDSKTFSNHSRTSKNFWSIKIWRSFSGKNDFYLHMITK